MHSTWGTHHGDVMLTLLVAGRGWYLHAGEKQAVSAGELGIVPPGPDPGILMADPDEPYSHYYCRFAGREASAAAMRIRERRGGRAFAPCPDFEGCAAVMEDMCAWSQPHHGGYLSDAPPMTPCEGLLLHLLARLQTPPAERPPAAVTEAALRRYVYDHLSVPFDLAAAARHFGVSRSHLCRAARQQLGEPLGRFARSVKLAYARTLLAEPALSVQEVAKRVGYPDPLHFSKVFRRAFGEPPTRARRRHAPPDSA